MEGTRTAAVTFTRVRDRLHKYGLQLELHAESDGFRWDIAEKPLQTRRVFPTVQAALEHADIYTRVWYQEGHEGGQRRPAPQLKSALAKAASSRSPTNDPHRRDTLRRLDARFQARKRAWTSA